MNGYFRLICDKKKTSIQVLPPDEDGVAVSINELVEYLTNRNVNYDSQALYTIIGKKTDYEVAINVDSILEERESYKLIISSDKMSAIARFYAPSLKGELMTKNELMKDLAIKNVKFGIQEDAIDDFFNNRRYCEDFIIAKGKEPQNGTDAYIEYYFNTDLKARPTLRDDGSVDFFNLNTLNHCHKDDVIARLFPEDRGEAGMNIMGEKLKPRDVKKKILKYGKNITISDDKLTMISQVDGHVNLTDEKVFVSDVLNVDNIDSSIGNIDYEGSVHVRGNVCANFTLKARGNIEVQGIVEGAFLQAGGDIILARGINGMGRGVLDAQGNIIAKFMENTKATAGGYVSSESILHSTVQAGEEITVSGKRGFITGGRVCAANAITVKTLGSSMGADTIVEVGADPKIKSRIMDLQKEIQELTRVILSVQPMLTSTQQKLAKGIKLSPDQIQYLKSLIALDQLKKKERDAKTIELDEIQDSLGHLTGAQIIVTGTVFPGTRICIGDLSMVVQGETKYCRFIKYDGEVKMTAI